MAKRHTRDDLNEIEEKFRALLEGQDWTFLVADKQIAFRKAIANALTKAGCETVLEAKDGMDAVMAIKKTEGKVCAIVELNMPVQDGLQFMANFKKDARFADCPVILMSAETRKDRIIAAIKSGANAYLKKPFEPDALLSKLQELGCL